METEQVCKEFYQGCSDGNEKMVMDALETKRVDVDHIFPEKDSTGLCVAIRKHQYKIAMMLMREYPYLNIRNGYCGDAIRLMCQMMTEIEATKEIDQETIGMFVTLVERDSVANLDKFERPIRYPALMSTSELRNSTPTKILLSKGCNPNVVVDGLTPLLYAITKSSIENVKVLLPCSDLSVKTANVPLVNIGNSFPTYTIKSGLTALELAIDMFQFKMKHDQFAEDDPLIGIIQCLGGTISRTVSKTLEECCICAEKRIDNVRLPCSHQFCHRCVENLQHGNVVRTNNSQTIQLTISCPMCRREHDMTLTPIMSTVKVCNALETKQFDCVTSQTTIIDLCARIKELYALGRSAIRVVFNGKLLENTAETLQHAGVRHNDIIRYFLVL